MKSIGDGTLSYFEAAQDGVRAAVEIQKGIDEFNLSRKFKTPILLRIGLHTGECILEKDDIFGDVVNTASRFESAGSPGEILLSEETYNALANKAEIYCRFHKEVTLKGKKEPFNAYKAFWSENEIELDRADQPAAAPAPPKPGLSKLKLALILAIPVLVVLALSLAATLRNREDPSETHRSVIHSTTPAPAGAK